MLLITLTERVEERSRREHAIDLRVAKVHKHAKRRAMLVARLRLTQAVPICGIAPALTEARGA
jgi:hypothetical protein